MLRVFLVLIALVGAYFFGAISTLCAVEKVSPAAYFVLKQDIKWKKAEMKNEEENDEADEGRD